MLVPKRYFVLYLEGDMALCLLQKVQRGDFLYWTPIDGVAGLFVSFIVRVMVKIIIDFTGLIQLPQSTGGWRLVQDCELVRGADS